MASYQTAYKRSRPVKRDSVHEIKLGDNRLCIYDHEHQVVETRDLTSTVVMLFGPQSHPRTYTLPLALVKATPSAISAALTSGTPTLSLQNTSNVLDELATSRNGVLAFETFHYFLHTGILNTSKFIDPAKDHHLTRNNSTNVGYSFQLAAVCLQMGVLLQATRFVDLAHHEIRREFLSRPLVVADFLMIEKLAGGLDGFLIDWVNAIENDTTELRDHKLSGLRDGLEASLHIRQALTGMTANYKVVRLIEDAHAKEKDNHALPGTSNPLNPQPANGTLLVYVLGQKQLQDAIAQPSVQRYAVATMTPANAAIVPRGPPVVLSSSTSTTITAAATAVNGPRRRMRREVSPFHDTRDLGRGKREKKPVARY